MSDYDINSIQEQLAPETDIQVGGDDYVESSEFIRPLDEGTYTLKQGPLAEQKGVGVTKRGALALAFAYHEVSGGERDGSKLSFDRVNFQTFDRGGYPASSGNDHLRAVGFKEKVSNRDVETIVNIVRASEGKPFKAVVRWEASCPDCVSVNDQGGNVYEVNIKGAGRFPKFTEGPLMGKPNHVVPCPKCGRELGAQARIDRRFPVPVAAATA